MELDYFPAQIIDYVGADTSVSSPRLSQMNINILAETLEK